MLTTKTQKYIYFPTNKLYDLNTQTVRELTVKTHTHHGRENPGKSLPVAESGVSKRFLSSWLFCSNDPDSLFIMLQPSYLVVYIASNILR